MRKKGLHALAGDGLQQPEQVVGRRAQHGAQGRRPTSSYGMRSAVDLHLVSLPIYLSIGLCAILAHLNSLALLMFDLSNLKKISRLGAAAPAAMKGFQELDKAALADGAISKKHKELIAVGVALTTQCGYCLEVHRKAAIAAGATEQELAEATFVAVALRAGAALTHGTHLMADAA